jgi:hypothetical protein
MPAKAGFLMDVIKKIKEVVSEAISAPLVISIIYSFLIVSLMNSTGFLDLLITEDLRSYGALFFWVLFILIFQKVTTFKFIHEPVRYLLVSLEDLYVSRAKTRKYSSNFKSPKGFSTSWSLQGFSGVSNEGLLVANSNAGILLSTDEWYRKNRWKDFYATLKVNFDIFNKSLDTTNKNENEIVKKWVKIEPPFRSVLGVIFRAQDLNNCLMIELWKIENKILLKPHVKVRGNWMVPGYNSANFVSDLTTPKTGSTYTFVITVKDKLFKLEGDVKETIIWTLPDYYQINLGHLSEDEQKVNIEARNISFVNRPGMFGFRNSENELAVVKYLKIVPISEK